jgi:hypothetical protein
MIDKTNAVESWDDLAAYIESFGEFGPGCCVIRRGPITASISNIGTRAKCDEVARGFQAVVLSYTPGHDC